MNIKHILGAIRPAAYGTLFTLSAITGSELLLSTKKAEARDIPYRDEVSLQVGQKVVIHGLRGDCGSLPTNTDGWGRDTRLGLIYLGKRGTRRSRTCGGTTPAYEVIFEAERKGRETLRLFGDRIKIRVR